MEARETTRTGARYRPRTLCGAGGESTMLPGVMRVHLNYRVSHFRVGVLGFWGIPHEYF